VKWGPRGVVVLTLAWLAGIGVSGSLDAEPAAPRFLPWTGGPPPALALRDLAGRSHELAAYRGQVLVVNFWATWCEPCREEMPSLQRLRDRLAGRPFAILAVNYGESAGQVSEFLPRAGVALDFPLLLDPGQRTARAWAVRLLPMSFLVGADGQVRYRVIGELDWTGDEADGVVRRLLP
jgi:thiol-disulfide isomerase/thioredoxin